MPLAKNYDPAQMYGAVVNQYGVVAVVTNGTNVVNVFSNPVVNEEPENPNAPVQLTVTSVFVIAQDGTAGNITLTNAGNTVATIAKGTTSGALVGAASLANTVVSANAVFTVTSSSAGNANVNIVFVIGNLNS